MTAAPVSIPQPLPPLCHSIVDLIGQTPMVELHRFAAARGLQGRLLIKIEYMNPGLSKKDRIGKQMVLQARESGQLRPGQPVVELTSGNTGTGLALVCQALGHPFVAVMSRGNTPERARMMRALGAEVVLVDQAPGAVANQVSGADLALVELKTQQLVQQRGAFRASQFELASNPQAHELTTGPEIWQQSQGAVDVWVDFAGTAGTFTGTARYLRKQKPTLRAYLVEPAGAAAIAGKPITNPSHQIQGGGYSIPQPPVLDRSLITDFLAVTDEQAIACARELARLEGIFGGVSTGANLAAAVQLLESRERGATIALLACDSGLKYMSTDLYP